MTKMRALGSIPISIEKAKLAWQNEPQTRLALTHWGRDKISNIFKATFANSLSSMKIVYLDSSFSNIFPIVKLIRPNNASGNYLASNRRQAIIWTNDGLIGWCIYVLLALNEFNKINSLLVSIVEHLIHQSFVFQYQWTQNQVSPLP